MTATSIHQMLIELDDQTLFFSSAFQMCKTEAYQALLREGAACIPHLYEALPRARCPLAIMLLLEELTGGTPSPGT
jgi:hypothetical protein